MLDMFLYLIGLTAAGAILTQQGLRFLIAHGLVCDNYKGEVIPAGTGLVIWLIMLLSYWASSWFQLPWLVLDAFEHIQYILALTIIFVTGWIDDRIGDRYVKGLKGHMNRLIKNGIMTTGLIKAGMTAILTLWIVSGYSTSLSGVVLYFLLITLTTNAINLLDLRPGRAMKGFIIGGVVIIVAGIWQTAVSLLLPLMIGVILLLPSDLRAKSMLGDAGANILGFALGFTLVLAAPSWLQWIAAVVLIIVHWIAERSSLTKLIERNRILNWFDQLGRV